MIDLLIVETSPEKELLAVKRCGKLVGRMGVFPLSF
jgi:hypothetical protein